MQAPEYWMVTGVHLFLTYLVFIMLLSFGLCIEYAENGSLFEFLQQNQFNLERSLKWAKEIAQGKVQME